MKDDIVDLSIDRCFPVREGGREDVNLRELSIVVESRENAVGYVEKDMSIVPSG